MTIASITFDPNAQATRSAGQRKLEDYRNFTHAVDTLPSNITASANPGDPSLLTTDGTQSSEGTKKEISSGYTGPMFPPPSDATNVGSNAFSQTSARELTAYNALIARAA